MSSSITNQFIVAALYKFVQLDDCQALQPVLRQHCQQHHIKGTLLLATEGINGTVAGSRAAIDELKKMLAADGRFDGMEYKESFSSQQPFIRLKVRLKKEIVTIGLPDINPLQQVGTYVDPSDWNALINDPDVIVIDPRNDYEVRTGQFKKTINPEIKSFNEFPAWVQDNLQDHKHAKIAMSCTGGIRCEKASSYMLATGFTNIYHLKGGILSYLEKVPAHQSLWQGECFVFDNRVTVTHGVNVGSYDQCYGCRAPLSAKDKLSADYSVGRNCPYCINVKTDDDRSRYQERHKQVELAKSRHEHHLGSH